MLIGRERELERVRAALLDADLVTLTGPGGVGKTTLATEAAEAWDRHWFADLAPLHGDELPDAMAGDLGFASFANLAGEFDAEPGLLILDNCEHLLDAAADLAVELLRRCPELTLLATSRERLDVEPERVIVVEPLSAEGPEAPASVLFRAVAARGGATETGDPEVLATLTRRLDGLPLAIELAASRAGSFTPAEMLRHLDARLDILSRARRRGPARQHSLHAAISWSYQLLDDGERELLESLSVLSAPFTQRVADALDDGDAVTTLDRVASLVDRSLLVHDPVGDVSWYRLLETIQAYAGEQLAARGATDEVEERVVRHLLARTEEFLDEVATGDSRLPLELARTFRTRARAIERCLHRGELDRCHLLIAPLWWLEDVGHQGEAALLIERVLGDEPVDAARAMSASVAATLHRLSGREERASELATAVVAVDDGLAAAYAHRVLGLRTRIDGSWHIALAHFEAAVACAERAGDRQMAIEIGMHEALTMARSGRVAEAVELVERLREAARPHPQASTWLAIFLSWIGLPSDPDRTKRLIAELEPAAWARQDYWTVGWCQLDGAMADLIGGDDRLVPTAAARVAKGFELMARIRNRTEVVFALLVAAAVAGRSGRMEEARAMAATAHHDGGDGFLGPFEIDLYKRAGPWHEVDETTPRMTASEAAAIMREIAAAGDEVASAPRSHPVSEPDPAADPAADPDRPANRFAPDGDGWAVSYGERSTRARDSKGMHDLRALLAQPGTEVAAFDLMDGSVIEGSAGPVADATARRRYQERVRELQADIDEAETTGDLGRQERAQLELDRLVEELRTAYGLGGAERSTGTPAERARSAVRWRIRAAIERITEVHPELGAHLDRSVKTGRFCAYRPAEPTTWQTG